MSWPRHLFELTDKQIEQFSNWAYDLPDYEPKSVEDTGLSLEIIFTSLGPLFIGKRSDGHEINLTDFDTW